MERWVYSLARCLTCRCMHVVRHRDYSYIDDDTRRDRRRRKRKLIDEKA